MVRAAVDIISLSISISALRRSLPEAGWSRYSTFVVMHHVISVLSWGSVVPIEFSVLLVDLILWRRSFIIFADLLYDSCVLSDSLHPSSLWWNVSEFRG